MMTWYMIALAFVPGGGLASTLALLVAVTLIMRTFKLGLGVGEDLC